MYIILYREHIEIFLLCCIDFKVNGILIFDFGKKLSVIVLRENKWVIQSNVYSTEYKI